MKKIFLFSAAGSFTIEASFILPIIFLLVVAVIITSSNAHNSLINKANEISSIIALAPDVPEDTQTDLVDISKLNGRKVLLQYRLLKDGLKEIKGGLNNE